VAAFYHEKASSVGYYRGGRKDKEIDVVVEYANRGNILIEVKYRENAPVSDDDAICRLCKEASAAIIVTKRAGDCGVHNTASGDRLIRIPAFAFLYLLGHAEKHGR
jgi:predicted AAA+ superfamily ATPase